MPNPIITIQDDRQQVMQAGREVEIGDLSKLPPMIKDLKESLYVELPAVEQGTHPKPAYLAANQIKYTGTNVWIPRMVLLYLPRSSDAPSAELIMFNPTYTSIERVPSSAPKNYRISTFYTKPFRYADSCYASKVRVSYLDEHWKRVNVELSGLDAIAAQMGINFIYGITPLDHGISSRELTVFAMGERVENIMTTVEAYRYHGREKEINDKSSEFASHPQEWNFIHAHLADRARFPVEYDPTTGEKIAAKREYVVDDSLRSAFRV